MTDKFSESIDVGGRWSGEWSWERKEEIKNADHSQVRREHVWWGGAGRRGLTRKATTEDESGKRNPELSGAVTAQILGLDCQGSKLRFKSLNAYEMLKKDLTSVSLHVFINIMGETIIPSWLITAHVSNKQFLNKLFLIFRINIPFLQWASEAMNSYAKTSPVSCKITSI